MVNVCCYTVGDSLCLSYPGNQKDSGLEIPSWALVVGTYNMMWAHYTEIQSSPLNLACICSIDVLESHYISCYIRSWLFFSDVIASSDASSVRELQTSCSSKLCTYLCDSTYWLMGLPLVVLCQSWKWCSGKCISG